MTDKQTAVEVEGEVFQIREYDSFRESMKELQTMCNFLPDVSTDEGYAKSKELAVGGRKIFNALETARKERKKPVLEQAELIDSECKDIQGEITAAIEPHLKAYKVIDDAKRIKKAKLAEDLQRMIDELQAMVVAGASMEAEDIWNVINDMNEMDISALEHRAAEALKVRDSCIKSLKELGVQKQREEEDAKAAHEENMRLKEEQEKREAELKEEAERQEAAEEEMRLRQARMDEQEAELKRKQKAAEEEEEAREQAARDAELKKEREARAEKDRKEREEREEQIRKDAEAKAESDAKNLAERERVEHEEEEERRRQEVEYEEQQKAAAALKAEALRPDVEKLGLYGTKVQNLIDHAPVLKQKEVQEILDDAITLLDEAATICLSAGEEDPS